MKKTKMGQELIAGLQDAVEHARGAKKLRATALELPKAAPHWGKTKIATLRKDRFHMSQPAFAAVLNVTASTIRAWEQGRKEPSGAAERLLQVADSDPSVFQRLPTR
ncbi:MAG: helix-turn-helix domain-containing protein [Elusimicrobia bacterium]|nr:helix-turn-helix domain-containing protein [Elusimicrobiota bacterium]